MATTTETRTIRKLADKSYTRERAARAAAKKAQEAGQDWIVGWTGDIEEQDGRFYPILAKIIEVEVEESRNNGGIKVDRELLWKSKSGRILAGQSGSVAEAVWMMCYMLTAEDGGIPKARKVVRVGVEAGMSAGTVKNAYGLWKRTFMTNNAS